MAEAFAFIFGFGIVGISVLVLVSFLAWIATLVSNNKD